MQIEPWKRPRFADLVHSLEAMKYSALMKVILMDLSRLDLSSATPAISTDTAMDREALENILGMLRPHRDKSVMLKIRCFDLLWICYTNRTSGDGVL